ncbi:hypothetical protein D1871_14795, partial [Nakamurella silvestris]
AIYPAVEAAVLPDADGWNVPTLRKKCQAAVISLDPKGAQDRHRKAVADGMCPVARWGMGWGR